MYEHMTTLQNRYFEVWKGQDFITYKADKAKIDIRKRQIIQMMKDSDRYKLIKTRYMTKVFSDIVSNLDNISLSDNDILGCLKRIKTLVT